METNRTIGLSKDFVSTKSFILFVEQLFGKVKFIVTKQCSFCYMVNILEKTMLALMTEFINAAPLLTLNCPRSHRCSCPAHQASVDVSLRPVVVLVLVLVLVVDSQVPRK